MPYSFLNQDYYEMLGGTLWLRQGAASVTVENGPEILRRRSEMTCDSVTGCRKVWLGIKPDSNGVNKWERVTNGIGITDPDSKDYGYDVRNIKIKLSCSHGRLFVNERFLENVLFNGNLNCDLEVDPAVSESGCRVRLLDLQHQQGKVGLYTSQTSGFSESSTCAALVKYDTQLVWGDDGVQREVEVRSILSSRKVPFEVVGTSSKEWGCPCYSNVLFDPTGRCNTYIHGIICVYMYTLTQ